MPNFRVSNRTIFRQTGYRMNFPLCDYSTRYKRVLALHAKYSHGIDPKDVDIKIGVVRCRDCRRVIEECSCG